MTLLGGPAILAGLLFAHLGKVQLESLKTAYRKDVEYLRAELTRAEESHRAELGHWQHVSRVQFDLETQAYRQIWEQAVEVTLAAISLRPWLETTSLEKGKAEIRQGKLDRFTATVNNFTDAMWKQRPFYSAEVFAGLVKFRGLLIDEATDFEFAPEHYDADYWRRAKANLEAISSEVVVVADLMRNRIAHVQVVDR